MKSLTGLLVLTLAVSLSADDGHKHHGSPDGQLGKVKFQTSCDPKVQPQFERALAMLHSFWYEASENTFNEVVKQDPECAMGYWGIAMSLHHPLWAPASAAEVERGTQAIAKAKTAKKASERERAFIEALATVYDPANKSLPARNKAFAASMEKLHQAYPKDPEAAIFYGLALRATASPTDKTYAVQKKVGTIIDPLFKKQPTHPGLAHYVIHNYDYPELASLGLDAARRYAKIAPAAPHALHMPSHIFIRLGLWDDANKSNIDSANAAKKEFKLRGMKRSIGEQLHAMDYLAYGYLQRGEVKTAEAILAEAKAIQDADWTDFAGYYAVTAIPARVALETKRWAVARDIPEPTFTAGSYWTDVANGQVRWARAVGAARTGDAERARGEIAKLAELRDKLQQNESNKDGATMLQILVLSAKGWAAFADKRTDDAIARLTEAADLEDRTDKHPVTPGAILPAREQLGDLLMEVGRSSEALNAYAASLKLAPNRFNSLQGAMRAAKASGKSAEASHYSALLKKIAPNAEPEMANGAVTTASR